MKPLTRRRGGELMVPEAEFTSYHGRPVLKETVWGPAIASYLFLGGLAGASSALAAGAQLSGHPQLARTAKAGSAGAISLSMAALVYDLGRPARLVNMLRVFKVTSPMSVGTWLLSAYTPLALAAAASAGTRKLPRAGLAATVTAAVLGPGVATYTSVLLGDTAVPAWHDAHRELPYLFVGSAATAAGGLGLLAVKPEDAGPAVRLATLGAAAELTADAADRPAPRPGGRALPDGAIRGTDAGRPDPRRRRDCGGPPRPPEPRGVGAVRGSTAGWLGRHPVRRLRGRQGLSPRPEVHGRAPT